LLIFLHNYFKNPFELLSVIVITDCWTVCRKKLSYSVSKVAIFSYLIIFLILFSVIL